MSDNQRRACCRILFLLTCFLPTGFVGYWICHPQSATGWEQAIQAELGITTSIDSVSTPGPYVTILHGLEFSDPEVGRLFYTVEAKIEYGGKLNYITIPWKAQNLDSKGLALLVSAVNNNVIRKHRAEQHWKIVFEKPTVVSQSMLADFEKPENPTSAIPSNMITPVQLVSSVTLKELEIDLGPAVTHEGSFVMASFHLTDPSDQEDLVGPGRKVNCTISKTAEFGSRFKLETNDNSIPCWLASDALPSMPSLGTESTFQGTLEYAKATPIQSRLELAGVFQGLDLSSALFIGDSQTAKVEVNKCVYANNELDWDAFLNYEGKRIRIREEDMFNYEKRIDLAKAFSSTLGPKTRSAELESPFVRHR